MIKEVKMHLIQNLRKLKDNIFLVKMLKMIPQILRIIKDQINQDKAWAQFQLKKNYSTKQGIIDIRNLCFIILNKIVIIKETNIAVRWMNH